MDIWITDVHFIFFYLIFIHISYQVKWLQLIFNFTSTTNGYKFDDPFLWRKSNQATAEKLHLSVDH